MSVTAQLADGRVLEFPDGTSPDVIQRTVKSVLGQTAQSKPEWRGEPSAEEVAGYRAEHPVLSTVADLSTGLSGTMRGAANLLEKGYHKLTGQSDENLSSLITGEKPAGLGDKIWPKAEGSEGSGAKLVGALADPVPWLIAGGMGKVAPYMKIGGQGFWKGLQATGRNALTGGTTGMAIGGLSDEGSAAGGALTGAAVSAALPAAGVVAKWVGAKVGDLSGPVRESWRTNIARKYFDDILGANRGKVAAALANANEIVPGSPTTAADRIAGATMGGTDKYGSAIVKAQDLLSGQSSAGISDAAKSIEAAQEAARAAELAKVARTPAELSAATVARKAASKANYAAAFQRALSLDPELATIADNPYVKDALPTAIKLAEAEAATSGAQVGGTQFLHYLKLALDKQLRKTGDTALADTEKRAVAKVQEQLVNWIGRQNPEYEAARAAHEAASKPINQMKLGQELSAKLHEPVGAAERPSAFANAVRIAENKVSKATGRPRIADLTAEQRASIQAVQDELARNAERAALGSGVSVKNLFDIAEKGKGSFHLPNLLSRPAMITNWIMGQVGNTADDLIARDVGKLLLTDPQGFATKYLTDVPMNQRQIVMALVKQKLSGTGPYARASIISASQNGQ